MFYDPKILNSSVFKKTTAWKQDYWNFNQKTGYIMEPTDWDQIVDSLLKHEEIKVFRRDLLWAKWNETHYERSCTKEEKAS